MSITMKKKRTYSIISNSWLLKLEIRREYLNQFYQYSGNKDEYLIWY